MHPHAIPAGAPQPGGQVKFGCQTVRPGKLTCYGPDQLRAAYRIQPLLDRGITGKGRTIVIVDAFSNPAVREDLVAIDAVWGIPDPDFQVIAPYGVPAFDPTDDIQVGWSAEIALDVQWAHFVAPGAKIVLVEATSSDDAGILKATRWAVDHNLGDVISQSFGEDERCVDPTILAGEHRVFADATRKGITLIASAGDQGSAQPTCDGSSYSLAASSPASDPLVLGIGGTSLDADLTTGEYHGETVWNESAEFGSAGGGGFSALYPKPGYQSDAFRGHRGRGVPDVAYNGGINAGVLVNWSVGGGVFIFGGTSSGSPQWAGLVALTDQVAGHRVGFVNPELYDLGHGRTAGRYFHDVTVGDNTFSFTAADGSTVAVPGYPATKGWDASTGIGTPIADTLVKALADR